MDFINGLRLPIIVLGYNPRKLFSVADKDGKITMPVFSNAEYARNYQKYFQEKHDIDVMTLILTDYEKAVNLFEVISMVDEEVEHVVVDPMPPTIKNLGEKLLSFPMQEYIKRLHNCWDRTKKARRKNN